MNSQHALYCLAAIARKHGIDVSVDALIAEHGTRPYDHGVLTTAAREIGLQVSVSAMEWPELIDVGNAFPLLVQFRDQTVGILAGFDAKSKPIIIRPPEASLVEMSPEEFQAAWNGTVFLFKRKDGEAETHTKFDMRWFLPEILKHKTIFRDIAIATFALGIVGLGTPIFTQQVIDKVMVHQNVSTLTVLTVGVVVLILFETIFTYIRTYLLNSATRKIDLRLSRETFAHLTALPLEYFERRAAGIIVRQLQQVGVIRNFLTGSLFFTALESVMFFIFLPILLLYSVTLTLIVLAISLIMAGLTYILIGPYRRRLEKVASIESIRQGMLTESVHGARTVKALAIEKEQRKVWDQRTANTMDLLFDVMTISNIAASLTQFLQRIMTIAIMVAGSFLVIKQEISLGTLIGFQMLSARVTGPLAMLVGLIHEYQQVRVSANMLADVMDTPKEVRASSGLRSKIKGQIGFENVSFKYPGSQTLVLDHINFNVKEGEILGMVGRSGSGKSTVAKLLQGLYHPVSGVIRLDGIDLREFETPHLRRQVGVVLQDSFLFRGTVRENISAPRPAATLEEVIQACHAAGAAEFVEKLPQSYETLIEENAANLSGGQRQRLAIARTLIARPKIVIFDEATSALDPESEAVVMESLSTIAQGRTVVIISHRLSTLVSANRIAFLENGKLLAIAPHAELLQICPPYAKLWNQQNGHLQT